MEDNYETFEQVYEEKYEPKYGYLRPIVSKVIYQYLDCGILYNGFAKVKCKSCGHEYLLAFSCKRRHFCPLRSCQKGCRIWAVDVLKCIKECAPSPFCVFHSKDVKDIFSI